MIKNAAQKIIEALGNAINYVVENKADYVKNPSDFSRNRCFGMKRVISTTLGFSGKSLNKEIFDIGNPATVSAFIQQRNKINGSAFRKIFEDLTSNIPAPKKHKGFRLLAIDGSEVNTPYNKESEFYHEGYVNQNGLLTKGNNTVHLHTMYDLLNKTVVDYKLAPQSVISEQLAAKEMVKAYDGEMAICIFDRGYPSYNLIEHIIRKPNMDFVMRVSSESFKKIQQLPECTLDVDITSRITSVSSNHARGGYDALVSATSPKGKIKKRVSWDFGRRDHEQTIRVVRFQLDNGEYETLVTSLMDREAFPATCFKELYHLRWGIETSFRELKYNLGAVNFHSRSDEFVKQEIVAKIIMYNYSMAITMCVALPEMKKRKLSYMVDRTMAIYVCMNLFRGKGNITIKNIEAEIQRYLQPIRPGRNDKRNIIPKGFIPFVYRVAA